VSAYFPVNASFRAGVLLDICILDGAYRGPCVVAHWVNLEDVGALLSRVPL
jgi:hypothetical protein